MKHQIKHQNLKNLGRGGVERQHSSKYNSSSSKTTSSTISSSTSSLVSYFSHTSNNFLNLIFWFVIIVYALLVWLWADFGVIDDHTFTKTLFLGQNIPFIIIPSIGRFFPLDGQDLNILSFLFAPNASVFYGFNALCIIITALALRYAFMVFLDSIYPRNPKNPHPKANATLTLALIFLVLFSPSFVTANLRLFCPERMEFVFLSLFLASYAYVYKSTTNATPNATTSPISNSTFVWLALLFGLVFANLSLYYKETAFAMLLAFGGVGFILGFKQSKLSSLPLKFFHFLLILSSVIWLVVYYFAVVIHQSSRYGETPYNQLIVFAKVAFNYMLNEPFLFIALPCLFLYRIYACTIKKQQPIFLLDASIIASLVLICEYLVLRIGDTHYPLPAYIFGCIGIGGFLLLYGRSLWVKILYGFCLVLFVCNALPYSVYQFNFYKAVPHNFQSSLEFLSGYLKQHPNSNIYLEGVNRASGTEVHHSLSSWLNFYGVKDFDLRSDIGIDNAYLGKPDPKSPYSALQSNAIIPKQKGDIVIICPYTLLNVDTQFLQNLDSQYELLYVSDFGFNLPKLGIKPFLKSQAIKNGASQTDVVMSENIWGLPLYFYIYRVK
ncbi:Uncharacterised protein [Helicobacter fennelliae]|uniref:Uncharacterized protein n=1 Tax=Helicobacter fennelliae TaxID=215 RepID=A0A2X3AWW6_9HELI|nr:hypothetical protein [Helicobacter fennelliae]SQB97328.1 Uncharacterised protein [Helicobacter fennelliae]